MDQNGMAMAGMEQDREAHCTQIVGLCAAPERRLICTAARSRAVVLIGCDFPPLITGGVCQGHRCGPNVIIWLTAKVESLTRLVHP